MGNHRWSMRTICGTVIACAFTVLSVSVDAQTAGAEKGSGNGRPSQTAPAGMTGMGGMAMGDLHQSMTRNMQQMQSMPMSGDTDRDFATMMRTHHQGAIDMSEVELKNGHDPDLKAFAKRTIAAQKKEIEELERWLAKNKSSGASKK